MTPPIISACLTTPFTMNSARRRRKCRVPALLARCQKMLDQQQAVLQATKALHKVIDGKTPRAEDRKAAVSNSPSAKSPSSPKRPGHRDPGKGGVAVAFPEVFRELKADMEVVERRLQQVDPGPKTQALRKTSSTLCKR